MIRLYKYSYYSETRQCEAWLEEMASNGWMAERFTRNLDFVRFKKEEPKLVHYHFYFDDERHLDEESFIQSAKEQGWINLNKNPILARAFLFVSTDPHPEPLETDLIEQENMYRPRKKMLSKYEIGLLIAALILIPINMHYAGLWFIVSPGLWPAYTFLFWKFELMFLPKRYKRFSDLQRRILALFFRVLRFSIIPIWILLFIFIQ